MSMRVCENHVVPTCTLGERIVELLLCTADDRLSGCELAVVLRQAGFLYSVV